MDNHSGATQRALKRMLANGRLTAMPKRHADQALLATLAVAGFDAGTSYLESDVNERLEAWLEKVSEPYGIDHVTMRRLLVDSRLLTRTTSGSNYQVNDTRLPEIDAVRKFDPESILAEVIEERKRRKRAIAR
jgi:hypothetical protein